jgi:hypothetical protein
MAGKDIETKIEEQALTEMLYYLLEERSSEGGISEDGLKREMRLKEVQGDIRRKLSSGKEFTPTDFVRLYGLLLLFILERGSFITFPYKDVFAWQQFKDVFYKLTADFDQLLDFKKTKGRPSNAVANFLVFSGTLCREHNSPSCDHRYACTCNYSCLLADILKLRLARSQEWHRRAGTVERRNILRREYRAAKTALDRFWTRLYGRRPPKLGKEDKEFIKEFSIRSVTKGF